MGRQGILREKEIKDREKGTYYTGNLRGIRLKYWPATLIIDGSLPQYSLGNNVLTPTFDLTRKALLKLGQDLGIPIEEAKITRLDIGATFQMDYPVKFYLDLLQSSDRYKVSEYSGETKQFYNSLRKVIFYDKIKEQQKKNKKILAQLFGPNSSSLHLLRYEIQYKKKLNSQLGFRDLRVKDLLSGRWDKKLVERLKSEYRKIRKKQDILDFKGEDLGVPKEFKASLASHAISKIGQAELYDLLERKYRAEEISKKNYYSMKSMINKVESKFLRESKYLKELDKKINDVEKYALFFK